MVTVASAPTIGAYRIVGVAGRGSFATVYRAYGSVGGAPVALKVLDRHLGASPDFADRFATMASRWAAISSIGCAPLIDWGMAEQTPFLVTPWLVGGSLDAWRTRPFTAPRSAAILSQLAVALEAIHAAGLVHGDLRPPNIFLGDDGRVVVSDIGLATLFSEDPRLRHLGGPPATYRAPEIGMGGALSIAGDLYALGVLAYLLLTGELPFVADTANGVLALQMSSAPTPPSLRRDAVPPALDGVVERLLARDPVDRYARAAAVVEDLQPFLVPIRHSDIVGSRVAAADATPGDIRAAPEPTHLPRRFTSGGFHPPHDVALPPTVGDNPAVQSRPSSPRRQNDASRRAANRPPVGAIVAVGFVFIVLLCVAAVGATQPAWGPVADYLALGQSPPAAQPPSVAAPPATATALPDRVPDIAGYPTALPTASSVVGGQPTSRPAATASPAAPNPTATTGAASPTARVNPSVTPAPTQTSAVRTVVPGNDLLVLVTKQQRLPETYAPSDLVAVDAVVRTLQGPQRVRREVLVPLQRMVIAMRDAGLDPVVASAYRSYQDQVATYNYWVRTMGQAEADRVSARPGHSEHQLGLAIDFASAANRYQLEESFAQTPEGRWLAQNAYKYGFIMSYPQGKEAVTGYAYEPWHYRYVGEVAAQIGPRGLTLQEFLEGRR